MKRFEFPLARVFRWYEQAMHTDEMALKTTLEQIRNLDHQMQAVQRRKLAEQTRMQLSQAITGYELQALALYAAQAERETARLRHNRTHLTVKAEEQRTKLVASRRRVRLIENLEGRRREEWVRELDKEENANASDLFLAKLAREGSE